MAKEHGKWRNSLKNEFGYWAGLISALMAIFDKIFELPKWAIYIWASIVAFFLVDFFRKLFKFIKESINVKKSFSKKYEEETRMLCEEVHKVTHNLRNYTNSKTEVIVNRDAFKAICRNVCCDIEQVFKRLWGCDTVPVCIKRIITNEIVDDDFEQWEVETLARSSGCKQDRSKKDSEVTKIPENSDFHIIVSNKYEDSVFLSPNLAKIEEDFLSEYKMEYKNSTKNFHDLYNATIVVPIRIPFHNANKIIKDTCSSSFEYHIVGFLCIDTLKTFREDELKKFLAGAELAKAFADSLYKLFENNIIYSLEERKG